MSSVVQEYGVPNGESNGTRISTPPLSMDEQIVQTAREYGIERPRGHNVSFHYNSAVEQHHFGRSHPMKPWRLQLTKQLILSYGLQYAMECHESRFATRDEMVDFHNEDYLEFLEL